MKTEKWTVEDSVPGVYCIRTVPENYCVAVVGGVDSATRGQNAANARLLAAAPALRDALRELADQASERYPHFECERGQALLKRARAALAAAEPGALEFGPYSPPDPLPGKRVLRRELTPAGQAINTLFDGRG